MFKLGNFKGQYPTPPLKVIWKEKSFKICNERNNSQKYGNIFRMWNSNSGALKLLIT
jgi:hypothetical protein